MVDAITVIVFLNLAAIVGVALVWAGVHDRLLRRRTKNIVVVTLKSGLAFRGVLFEVDNQSFVLRNAEALEQAANGTHVPVDGEVFVARSEVEFLQRP